VCIAGASTGPITVRTPSGILASPSTFAVDIRAPDMTGADDKGHRVLISGRVARGGWRQHGLRYYTSQGSRASTATFSIRRGRLLHTTTANSRPPHPIPVRACQRSGRDAVRVEEGLNLLGPKAVHPGTAKRRHRPSDNPCGAACSGGSRALQPHRWWSGAHHRRRLVHRFGPTRPSRKSGTGVRDWRDRQQSA
jgi:hypothetical protein